MVCDRIVVVLPAYDEAAGLAALLPELERVMRAENRACEVIVVDDGSRDGTSQTAQAHRGEMPLRVLKHRVNEGLGATVRDGLRAAAGLASDDDVIVVMDADNTHRPEAIGRMVTRIQSGADVVIASRYQPGSQVEGVPWHRRGLSFAARVVFQAILPVAGVRDYTCGYRAYRAAVIRRAFDQFGDALIDQDGFQCMADLLIKLSGTGVVFQEIPFTLRYDAKAGASKMRVVRTMWRTCGLILRRRLMGRTSSRGVSSNIA